MNDHLTNTFINRENFKTFKFMTVKKKIKTKIINKIDLRIK